MMALAGTARRLAAPVFFVVLVAAVTAAGGGPRALVTEGRDRALAPALSVWLGASGREALAEGVAPMPADIRQALSGFLDDDVLDRVRHRIGGGSAASVQRYAFLHPQTRAITLEGVIVFRDRENAAKPRYWVHEIAHLEQMRRWGLRGFARRYVRDAAAVEREAWRSPSATSPGRCAATWPGYLIGTPET